MSENESPDLRALAEQVVAQAEPGEALEVVVGQSSNASVRAYDGDVEAMTVAQTAGEEAGGGGRRLWERSRAGPCLPVERYEELLAGRPTAQ